MGGDVDSPGWQAFKASLPALAAPQVAQQAVESDKPSPLAPRLKRKATRHGDGVPYGSKGPTGLYREGVKEMSDRVAKGELSAADASSQLADVGVTVSAYTLSEHARNAPGKSPQKGGGKTKLVWTTERDLHSEVELMRRHDITVTKSMIFAMTQAKMKETGETHVFKDGMPTDQWYYAWLDRFDMSTDDTKPLESDRDLWLTSKNAEKQYAVWAGIAIRNGMAERNPNFDPDKPYDEMIIWYPSALAKLISMDETDVRQDQTKRGKPAAIRSVRAQAPGSRAGHGKAVCGRRPREGDEQKSNKKPRRGGFVDNKPTTSGKHGARPGEVDMGTSLVTKSASKISFAGGTRGDSKSLSPLIISDHPLSAAELDAAPCGTARNPVTGELVRADFSINGSGGMETPDMIKWLVNIAAPSTGCTPTNRGMMALDGLGQHHSYPVIKKAIELGLDVGLRFPHGSSRNQHEDFEHFAAFKPAHEAAKVQAQAAQFQELRAKAAAAGRTPFRAELMAASVLSNEASLRAAREPWHAAFAEDKVKQGWANEGVVPFTRKLYWDLKAEEERRGIQAPPVPAPNLSGFEGCIVPAAGPSTSTALIEASPLSAEDGAAWDAGIDAEVERLLREEVGDLTLQVAPVAPPKRGMPKLTSALLFQLPGGPTGEQGRALIRAKEIERRLAVARSSRSKDRREEKKRTEADEDWAVAAAAMATLEAGQFDLSTLSKAHLLALVRTLKVGKAVGNKDALKGLLVERFGHLNRSQFEQIKLTVTRGAAMAALPAPAPVPEDAEQGLLALPAPAPTAMAALPAPSGVVEQPIAVRRPRRGHPED